MPAFEKRSLLTPKFTVSLLQVTAVVRGIYDDRVVELAAFFEFFDESPDGPIRIVDGAAVDCFPFVECAILGNDLVGRRDRVVGFVEPEIEKEGFIDIALLIEPSEGLVDNDLAGIAFDLADALSVAHEVGRVLVTGARAIDDAEPVVEAMIGGSRIFAILDGHTEVPLSEVSGGVTVFLEHFGDGRFALQEMHAVKALVEDGVDTGARIEATCEISSARGRACRSPRVEIGEAHASGGQFIENGSLHRTAVTSKVPVTEIVDK